MALDERGKLWAWGSNTSGELGTGDYEARSVPLTIPALFTTTFAKVFCGPSHVVAVVGRGEAQVPVQYYSAAALPAMSSIGPRGRSAVRIPGKIQGTAGRSREGKRLKTSSLEGKTGGMILAEMPSDRAKYKTGGSINSSSQSPVAAPVPAPVPVRSPAWNRE